MKRDLELVLGLDAGGSKTRAAVADATGRVLGRAEAGPGNPLTDWEQATQAWETARSAALVDAGAMELPRVSTVWMGAAGAGRPSMRRRIYDWVARRGWARHTHIATDAENVLWIAGSDPAVGLIAGTGSMAISRDASGTLRRAGGWGPLLGDEGGGYWAAIRAVREVLLARDRGDAPPPLAEAVFAFFGVAEAMELPRALQAASRSRIASFASQIGAAAEQGDGLARQIVVESAGHLATLAARVAPPEAKSTCTLVLAGGWLLGCPELPRLVRQEADDVHRLQARRMVLAPEPVMGAIQAALQHASFSS